MEHFGRISSLLGFVWLTSMVPGCSSADELAVGDTGARIGAAAADSERCRSITFPAPVTDDCDGVVRSVQGRDYCLKAPSSGQAEPLPVVLSLHAYGENGARQAAYFALNEQVDARRFILVKPNGTLNSVNQRFWNALSVSAAGREPELPDDVAHLDAVLADVRENYAIDAKRIYLIGYSNGAFMAHRYACERASTVAAFVSFQGGVLANECQPSEPVSMAEIRGNDEPAIPRAGGALPGTDPTAFWPSLSETMSAWTGPATCKGSPSPAGMLDLAWDSLRNSCAGPADGADTEIERYDCSRAGIEHWKLLDSLHGPALNVPGFARALLDFFDAHPKSR